MYFLPSLRISASPTPHPQGTEEIEHETNPPPANVRTGLGNSVVRPLKAIQPKRVRAGEGMGTGGLILEGVDEGAEAEEIPSLETRTASFKKCAVATGNVVVMDPERQTEK